MNPAEDLIRSTTAALAATVRDVPALRLAPAEGELASFAPRSRGARRLRGWLTPVAAAAVVLAVALSLVIVRDLPNGRVVSPATPRASSTGDAPGYYLMIGNYGNSGSGNGLQVRDTFTGKEVAFVAPPKASTFAAVTGAANDRTFVADSTGYPQDAARGARQDATWYLITLAPGSSIPARLTRLPIPATMNVGYVASVALSRDGRELAVAYVPKTQISLRIYSVATGKLLNSWSASGAKPPAMGLFADGFLSNSTLSWVDGDRALAFATSTDSGKRNVRTLRVDHAIRVLDVTARGGDLIADSRVVWSRTDSPFIAFYTRPVCNSQGGSTVPYLTADGKTVVCAGLASSAVHHHLMAGSVVVPMVWLGFSITAPKVARTLYKVTVTVHVSPAGSGLANSNDVRWADASGSTMIVDWSAGSGAPNSEPPAHFGLVRDGRFTPLPSPPGSSVWTLVDQAAIAW